MKLLKTFTVVALFALALTLFAVSGEAAAKDAKTADSGYNIYFRPAIRWGTNDRVLYIADFLIPLYRGDKNILFANPKFTPNDRDGWEVNVGLGYRHLLWDGNLLLGLNAFYDKRKSDWGNYHEQWGVGAEVMADIPMKKMDLGLTGRFNFYSPTSPVKMKYGDGAGNGGYLFQTLGIYSGPGGEAIVEEPMRGFDYELGVRIPYLSDYVETWTYAGGYNYFGKYTEHVDGFSARIEVIPTDFLRLNFEYKNDNINHDEFYGEVAVEVPFSITNLVQGKNPFEGLGRRLSGSRDLRERMVEPVRRDVDIVIVETTLEEAGGAGGGGGLIEEVIFVSEGGETDPSADGTFEHPWPSVDAAIAGDARLGVTAFTIHIINDDGGDGFAGGGNFTAFGAIANLLIWGSGTDHPNYPAISNMTAGFPEMNTTLTVDDAGAEIMGIYFNNAGGDGLIVQGGPGTLVHHNVVNANGGYGVWLNGFNTTSVYGNAFAGSGNYSLLIGAGDTANIYDNTFTGLVGLRGNDGATNVTIDSNTFDVTVVAVNMEYGGNNIENLDIINNTINVNSSVSDAFGIRLFTDLGGADIGSAGNPVNIDNNTITGSSSSGAGGIVLRSNGDIFADITNNDMTGGITGDIGAAGIILESINNIGLEFNPVTITNNWMAVSTASGLAYGINLKSDNSDIFTDITGNDMTGGITSSGGGGYTFGINLESTLGRIGSEADPVNVNDNRMVLTTGAGGGLAAGIYFFAYDDVFSTITGNNISNTIGGAGEAAGIVLRSDTEDIGSALTPVTVSDNTITVNGDFSGGIIFPVVNNIFADITGNTMTGGITGNSAAYGIYFETNSPGNIGFDGTTINPVSITNNPMTVDSALGDAFGIYLDTDNDLFVDITGNDMTGGISGAGRTCGIFLYSGDNIGYDGTTVNPVNIDLNPMTVTSGGGEAYGILLNAADNIFADITGNDMTGGITGAAVTYGIWLTSGGGIGYDPAATTIAPVVVDDNLMTVLGSGGVAAGIYLSSYYDLFAEVTGNDMTGGITGNDETWGIYLDSSGGHIGSNGTTINPVLIDNNSMTVTSNGLAAYGIDLVTSGAVGYNIFADITNNDMTGGTGIRGDNALGILLQSTSDIGGIGNWAYIYNNGMAVTGTSSYAYGILLYANGDIFTGVTENDMTGGITGVSDAFGIWISSGGSVGYDPATITAEPVAVSDNPMTVLSSTGSALGIYIGSNYDLFAEVTDNDMTGGITGAGNAYGIYLDSASGNIGSDGMTITPAILSGNSMLVTGNGGNAYGINLDAYYDIYANINSNVMNGITGGIDAYGILLDAAGTGGDIYADIADNDMTGGVAGGNDTYGIYLHTAGSVSDIFTIISGNDMTGVINGGNEAWGIYLNSENGYVGSNASWVMIYNNLMGVTATNDAHGIHLDAYDSIYADITGNVMSGGIIGGGDAYGIRLDSSNSGISAIVRNSIMSGAISGGNSAYGVHLGAEYGIITDITGNLMTGGITGNIITCGIELNVLNGYIETVISGNDLSGGINGGVGEAYGISLDSTEEIEGAIGNNNLGGISGAGLAAGIYLNSSLDDIGTPANPIQIIDNSMTVSSTGDNAYGINLDADNDIYANINSNIINGVSGGIDAYGIGLDSNNGGIEADILDNNMSGAISGGNNAYGIHLGAEYGIIGSITENLMTGGITGSNITCGIELNVLNGYLDTRISYNDLSGGINGGVGEAYGIRLNSTEEIENNIFYNNLGVITGAGPAAGIYLNSSLDDIGSWADPVWIYNNSMTVSSTGDNAYGINLDAGNDIYTIVFSNTINGVNGGINAYGIRLITDNNIQADISYNDLSGGVIGGNEAYGISLVSENGIIGYDWSGERPVTMTENIITAGTAAGGSYAYGIHLDAYNDIFADIIDNTMTGGIMGATRTYGIYLDAGSGGIGSSSNTVQIDGNIMRVIAGAGISLAYGISLGSDGDDIYATINDNDMTGGITGGISAYGIYLDTVDGDIFTDIYDNNMTGAGISGGNESHGIYLDSDYNIGGTGLDVTGISSNDMIVYAGSAGVASGISFFANDSIFAQINGNDMSGGITGTLTYGIRIVAGGYVGSSSSPVAVMNNLMTVTSSTGFFSATGIYMSADYSLYAYINNNTSMNITSLGSDAWGAHLLTGGGTIGSGVIATYFTNNSGTVDGPLNRYMLELYAGVPGSGSNVDWGMGGQVNSFTSLNGGVGANWTGNYDTGDGLPAPGGVNKPVETNFNAGDSLWP